MQLFPSAARSNSATAIACLCLLPLIAAPAGATEHRLAVTLTREISPHWFRGGAAGEAARAASGEIVLLGELNLRGDAPAHTSGFCLQLAGNTTGPLHIDQSTVVREFGKVVFFRFYASLPAQVASQDGLVMQWGDDLQCPNILVPTVRADPARQADYREIVFAPTIGASPPAEENQLDLKVVVDRQSSRYRLLYLLPILLVLVGVLVRARSSSEGPCDP
jgi:hypothetical protein